MTNKLQKGDLKSKLERFYFFKSCGYLHEKDIAKFKFTVDVLPIISTMRRALLKEDATKTKQSKQTTLFDFI